MNNNWIDETAREWIGASLERPEPGEVIDRAQLGEQLRAGGDDISADCVEAVARRIEQLAAS